MHKLCCFISRIDLKQVLIMPSSSELISLKSNLIEPSSESSNLICSLNEFKKYVQMLILNELLTNQMQVELETYLNDYTKKFCNTNHQ